MHKLSWFDLFTNDLRKGSKTFRLFFKRGSHLSDFRHCRPQDMVAVACTLAVWPFVALAGFVPLSFCLGVLGTLLALYWLTRFDLLASFATQGWWFLFRAALTMHLLDFTTRDLRAKWTGAFPEGNN